MSIEIRLSRPDKTYRAGESVTGVVVFSGSSAVKVDKFLLKANGVVKPSLDPRTVGLFEALYSSIKPISILNSEIELAVSGYSLPKDVSVPFEFPVEAAIGQKLSESYKGVYITTVYDISVELIASGGGLLGFNKKYEAASEFIVEVPETNKAKMASNPVEFEITPHSLENVKKASVAAIPKFLIKGRLDRTKCSLAAPFTGEITVLNSEAPIRSIELQLVRVETITYSEGTAREATEIQNLQIGDGDVPRNLAIPLYMIFPRLFTCPTSISDSFKVEFEVNVIIVFQDVSIILIQGPRDQPLAHHLCSFFFFSIPYLFVLSSFAGLPGHGKLPHRSLPSTCCREDIVVPGVAVAGCKAIYQLLMTGLRNPTHSDSISSPRRFVTLVGILTVEFWYCSGKISNVQNLTTVYKEGLSLPRCWLRSHRCRCRFRYQGTHEKGKPSPYVHPSYFRPIPCAARLIALRPPIALVLPILII
jgi:Vacuolar protein sorting-associated protein 26